MKIRVALPDGRAENITLTEPLTIIRGEEENALRTSTGMRHIFGHDGLYHGWEAEIGAVFTSKDEAEKFCQYYVTQINKDREQFLPPKGGDYDVDE